MSAMIAVYLSEEDNEALRDIAYSAGTPVGAVVNTAIKQFIARMNEPVSHSIICNLPTLVPRKKAKK